ncbi:hypothetical protein H9623_02825 [Oerskovia sp. Sa1BUA8]|uniref:Uncharacterized protein n=1 Tax=Oerskovia douganii TaxID=2762210 RepID=A0A9D5U6T7_9CELL|nr:hypothetical protein [Oerskovia douganii]MBE7699240.1 hypothetical protein [Oerskovia douganii]
MTDSTIQADTDETGDAAEVATAAGGEGDALEAAETDAKGPGAEAAKYRRQLREAEGERDQLRETVQALRTAAAEQHIAGILAKPATLWLTGVTVDDFTAEDGTLDVDALSGAARGAAEAHGLERHSVMFESPGAHRTEGTGNPPATWQGLLSRQA